MDCQQENCKKIILSTTFILGKFSRIATCPAPKVSCKDSKYRSFDGTCNNLGNPLFGSHNTPYKRFLPPAYGGKPGDNLPRGVTSYSPETGYVSSLPSPRVISAGMGANPPSNTTESNTNTHMVMQWGQFVDHDILSTAGEFFDCCQQDIKYNQLDQISDKNIFYKFQKYLSLFPNHSSRQ